MDTKKDHAPRIVGAILADLTDRRGLRHEWDRIDADIQAEIRATWEGLVRDVLAQNR
jgi:hypothetical protein